MTRQELATGEGFVFYVLVLLNGGSAEYMNLGKDFDRFVLIIVITVASLFTALGFALGALLT